MKPRESNSLTCSSSSWRTRWRWWCTIHTGNHQDPIGVNHSTVTVPICVYQRRKSIWTRPSFPAPVLTPPPPPPPPRRRRRPPPSRCTMAPLAAKVHTTLLPLSCNAIITWSERGCFISCPSSNEWIVSMNFAQLATCSCNSFLNLARFRALIVAAITQQCVSFISTR